MKRVILILLSVIMATGIAGCGKTGGNDNTIKPSYAADSEFTAVFETDAADYNYKGVKTAAPYRLMNEDGTIRARYDSMFRAIQQAGILGKNSNRTMVVDQQGYKIFQRESNTKFWCYDGTYFVGLKESKTDVDDFWKANPKSYVINGQGTAYARLGNRMMQNSRSFIYDDFELFSGAYNYMFSKNGYSHPAENTSAGYAYMRSYVEMSKAHYMPPQDVNDTKFKDPEPNLDTWNAYIFFNSGGPSNIDLGFIGNYDKTNDVVNWRLVKNCFLKNEHTALGTPSFTVEGGPVVTMTYNEETGDYTCNDDLLFELFTFADGFALQCTNLTTGVKSQIEDYHEGLIKNNNQNYLRTLLAASYCPTYNGGNVWNARHGGYLKDLIFSDINIARYNPQTSIAHPYGIYEKSSWEEFYPGTPNMDIGFSQSGDGATFKTGAYAQAGRIGSATHGAEYEAGMKYLNFSCYYDGSHH